MTRRLSIHGKCDTTNWLELATHFWMTHPNEIEIWHENQIMITANCAGRDLGSHGPKDQALEGDNQNQRYITSAVHALLVKNRNVRNLRVTRL